MKITTKITLVILLASLIPAEISFFAGYNIYKTLQLKTFHDHLNYIAGIKEERIQGIIDQMKAKMQLISHRKYLRTLFESYIANPQKEYQDSLVDILKSAQLPSETFKQLSVVLPNGIVAASTQTGLAGKPYPYQDIVKNALNKDVIHTLFCDQRHIDLIMGTNIAHNGSILGALIIEVDPVRIISSIRDYTGIGETGETLLAVHDGKETCIYVGPSQKKQKSEVLFIDQDEERMFLRQEDFREEKLFEMVEYKVQGEQAYTPVIIATRYLPDLNWGIMLKINRDEVMQPIRELRKVTMFITLISSLMIIGLAVIFAHTITRPIKKLHTITRRIREGELLERVDVESNDEIGELAASFNTMTDSLIEKTNELEQINLRTQQENSELTMLNNELDNLIHIIGHDLRNPLTTIAGFVEIFSMKYLPQLNDEAKMYIQKIQHGSDNLNSLIEDLLTLSRVTRMENEPEMVDVNDIVSTTIEDMEYKINENKVNVVVSDKMPTIYTDRVRLKIVFNNLISNAIKFSSKDNKEQPRVEIGYSEEAAAHTFYIADNGIGIDPRFYDKIFEMFKRLHSMEDYEGTGAGLSFVKRIIDTMQGTIRVESTPGEGATFYFSIPKQTT